MSDPTALLGELATLTKMTPAEWSDFVSATPAQQVLIVEGYRDADWSKSPDTLAKVLSVLGVLGTIAGFVSGAAGAAMAVSALRAL